jgi:Tol biopolymer transport system component
VFRLERQGGVIGSHTNGLNVYSGGSYYEFWGWTDGTNSNNAVASCEPSPSPSGTKVVYKDDLNGSVEVVLMLLEYEQNCI